MKSILILSLAIITFTTISCKKQRTCACTETTNRTTTYSNGNITSSNDVNSYTSTAEKQTKKYFRIHNSCYSSSTKSTSNNGNNREDVTTETTCTLK